MIRSAVCPINTRLRKGRATAPTTTMSDDIAFANAGNASAIRASTTLI